MNRADFNRILNLVEPEVSGIDNRRAFVETALYGCPVLKKIDWDGAEDVFAYNLVTRLMHYGECEPGKPALALLLEEIKANKGVNYHSEINALIEMINADPIPTRDLRTLLNTETTRPDGEKPRSKSRRSLIIGLAALIVISLIGLTLGSVIAQQGIQMTQTVSAPFTIISSASVKVMECPALDCSVIASLKFGDTVQVIDSRDNWRQIIFTNGMTGFIPSWAVATPSADSTETLTVTPTLTLTPPATETFTPSPILTSTEASSVTGCTPRVDWYTYTIQSGDTIGRIAVRAQSTVQELAEANCLTNLNVIFVGQKLYVPVLLAPSSSPLSTAVPTVSEGPTNVFVATSTPFVPSPIPPSNTPIPAPTATRYTGGGLPPPPGHP